MDWDNARRSFQTALMWVLAAALIFMLWWIRDALLLAFGAIMLAILLRLLAALIGKVTRLSEGLSLALATLLVIAVVGVTFWLFGSQMSSQFNELVQNVESGVRSLQTMFRNSHFAGLGTQVTERGASFITSSLSDLLSGGLRFAEAAVVLGISAIYLAAQPELYRHGLAMLMRPRQRRRAIESIDLIGRTLKLWLLGQLVLMLLVGVLSFVAVLLIGLPNPVALGLIAGITELIPYLGPFIGAIPAVLVALTQGLTPALWTIAAYLAIHIFEGYLVAPLIQRYFVTIPPALILTGIVAVDLLFGTIGVVLAAPVTVAIYMAIKMAYVDDPLEEENAERHRGRGTA